MQNPPDPGDDLKCPGCATADFKALGTEGFTVRKLAAALFGFPAGIAFIKAEQKNTRDRAIVYKCSKCGKKWKAFPARADGGACSESSCTIHFIRERGIAGGLTDQFVYLNGSKIGPVKNGEHISFTTAKKRGFVFVTDYTGRAFDTCYFNVPAGGQIELKFKRRFL
jgi:hypothetical protein